MSSTEAVVGGVVGGVVGFFAYGGPWGAVYGASIGYNLGAGYDTYKDLSKPRRSEPHFLDQRVNAGDYGTPIPIVYGRAKVRGILIWGRHLTQFERPGSEGGKGDEPQPGTASTWETRANFAVYLCRGPIIGISRLWLDDKLIYDNRDVNQGSTYNIPTGYLEVYTGDESQTPSPTIEGFDGAGNVLAYRGSAYLMFNYLKVDEYGERIPNVTAEVVAAGELNDITLPQLTLAEPSLPTFPVRQKTPLQLFYDNYSGLIIWHTEVSNYSSQPYIRVQVQGVRPTTHETVFSNTVFSSETATTWGSYFARDTSAPLLWCSGKDNLFAISTTNGGVVHSVPRVYGGFASTNSAPLVVVNTQNEIWISNQNGNFVFRKSDIQAGVSLTGAYKWTITIRFVAIGITENLKYVQHREWVLAQISDGPSFGFYDDDGTKLGGPYTLSGYSTCSETVIDAANDCIWFVARNFSPDVRDLYKMDCATGAFTLITTGCSYGEGICLDTILNCCVVYKWSTKNLEWFDAAGNNVKTLYTGSVSADAQSMVFVEPSNEIGFNLWSGFGPGNTFLSWSLGRLVNQEPQLDDIVTSLASEVGVSVGDVDASQISTNTVNGISVNTRTQARSVVDVLKRIGFFDLVHEDGKIKAKKFGATSSVMTIDYQDLIIPDDSDAKRPYLVRRADEIDLPNTVEVAYSDVDFEYETLIQSATRLTKRSKERQTVPIPAALTPTQAKQSAEKLLYQAWASRTTWTLNCSRKHWALNAGDVFTFVDELGKSNTLICVKKEMLGMTRMTVEAIAFDATVYSNTAEGSGSSWTPVTLKSITAKRVEFLDIPILRDSDDFPGFYVVGDSTAPSAALYESVDGGVTYTSISTIQEASTGYTTTNLATFTGGNVWDDSSTVTVTLYSGTLESVTDAQVLAGLNAAVVGNEIIQYATATLVSGTTYTLSRLLRGRKGTEWAIGLHSAGERFVPMSSALSRISSSAKGVLRLYKAARYGTALSDAPVIAFTNAQAGMKPYSPVLIQGSRDGSNNLTITWVRRSRIGSAWGSAIDIPLDDTLEKYEIDIMSGSTVKRTISVTSATTASYSAADQTTDFGSAQASVLVNVYQMSTIVGRGTVGVATI